MGQYTHKILYLTLTYGSCLLARYLFNKIIRNRVKLTDVKKVVNKETAKYPNIKFYEGNESAYHRILDIVFLHPNHKNNAYVIGHEVAHRDSIADPCYYSITSLILSSAIIYHTPITFLLSLIFSALSIGYAKIAIYLEETRADKISLNNCSIDEIIEGIKILQTLKPSLSFWEIVSSRNLSVYRKIRGLWNFNGYPSKQDRIKFAINAFFKKGGSSQMLLNNNIIDNDGNVIQISRSRGILMSESVDSDLASL